VKALDQDARAALRRLGVRFGAYHIFVPALVKPGPAGLLTLLWALKNDAKDRPGFGDVVQSLASGRTSVVTDAEFDPAFYRLAGFRVLGRRAVRVDILERLADLIRPALAWKAGTGVRPDGAFDGNAFTVTPAMMSILGAKAEDMEEILKGLGYRAEAKPATEVTARLEALDRAAQEAAEAAATAKAEAEAQAAAIVAAEGQVAAQEAQPEAAESGEAAASSVAAEPASEAAPAESQPAAEIAAPHDDEPAQPATEEAITESTDAPASPPPAEITAQDDAQDARKSEGGPLPSEEDGATGAVSTEPVAAEAAAEAEEPKPILLWRPARFDRGQRHQHHRVQGKGRPPSGEAVADGNRREERDGGNRRFERKGKPNRSDGGGQDRNGNGNGKRPHDGPRKGKPAFQKPREERPARFDPDSPFAKLAALRDQLKK
jgi:ATP-dependent RNA helicase SUPV3L1/SUV3